MNETPIRKNEAITDHPTKLLSERSVFLIFSLPPLPGVQLHNQTRFVHNVCRMVHLFERVKKCKSAKRKSENTESWLR